MLRVGVLRREGLADAGKLTAAEAGLILAQRRLVVAKETEALSLVAACKALGAASIEPAESGERG